MVRRQVALTDLDDKKALTRECWIAGVGILVLLGGLKHLAPSVPFLSRHAFTVASALQLYVPILLIGKRGITRASLGLSLVRWREDLASFALLSAATVLPFALGHHIWQTVLFHRTFALRLPSDLVSNVLTQVFAVALSEELFFRGYLQDRLQKLWPPGRKIFGAPFGLAAVSAASIFALAHFVGEYRVDRLGPFFPGLLFALLRARTGTIVGAISYHAFCNVLGDVLWACYRPS